MAQDAALRAVIYVADGIHNDEAWQWVKLCAAHCAHRGYRVIAVVIADIGGRWSDAVTMLGAGEAEVLVVGEYRQIPADRVPRVEIADIDESSEQTSMSELSTRRIPPSADAE